MRLTSILLVFVFAAAAAATTPVSATPPHYPFEVIGGFLGCWAAVTATTAAGVRLEPFGSGLPDDITGVMAFSLVVPAGMAAGTFAVGEIGDGRSRRPFRTWGFTTLGVTGQVFGGFAAFSALELAGQQNDWRVAQNVAGTLYGLNVLVAVCVAPFWYHHFKERPGPAQPKTPPNGAAPFAVSPFAATIPGADNHAVPVYGVSLSF